MLRTKTRGDGAPLGKNSVVILPSTEISIIDLKPHGQMPKRDYSSIPEKYRRSETSGLVREVKAGDNVFDFELKD